MEDLFLKILQAIDKGKKCTLATVVEVKGSTPRKQGSKMVVYENGDIFGTIGGGAVEYDVIRESISAIRNKKPIFKTYKLDAKEGRPMCGGLMSVFIEPQQKSLNMVIVGAGHIALPFSIMAKLLKFKVIVVDNRKEFANKNRFPHADKIILGAHDKELKKLNLGQESFIVIMTHGHRFDYPVIKEALRKDARYIGLMASQAKAHKFLNELKKDGFKDQVLKRIHSPVGLNIGAETPEEIAVSIIGEIIAVMSGIKHEYKFKYQTSKIKNTN